MNIEEIRRMQILSAKLFKDTYPHFGTYEQKSRHQSAESSCKMILDSLRSSVGWCLMDKAVSEAKSKLSSPELWFPKEGLHWIVYV